MLGISGTAGNVRGEKLSGGAPFAGWHSQDYPLPPLEMVHPCTMFRNTAEEMGLHPYPAPAANASGAHENPYGGRLAPCTCGG